MTYIIYYQSQGFTKTHRTKIIVRKIEFEEQGSKRAYTKAKELAKPGEQISMFLPQYKRTEKGTI